MFNNKNNKNANAIILLKSSKISILMVNTSMLGNTNYYIIFV